MAEVKIINLIKFYVVLLLSEGPKHGYEIIKEIEEKLKKRASAGQIYPFLKKLEKHGYIKSKRMGKREKRVYHLTKEGKAFVKRILNRFGSLIDIAIEPKLTECAHCGCKVYEGGHREVVKGKKLTFCCEYCARSYSRSL